MKSFKILFLGILISMFFIGCSASPSNSKEDTHTCLECYMPLVNSNIHTAIMIDGKDKLFFDDIGCLILWAQKNKIDLNKKIIQTFSNESKKYIDTKGAYFSINEKTPMLYGFSAYEKPCNNCINFDEVVIRMLRGEHMANPKIRKHILGY